MAGWISALVLLGAFASEPKPPPPEGFCVDCHKSQDERRLWIPTSSIAKSAHAHLEGGCVNCHGGEASEPTKRAHDPRLGFRGKPKLEDTPRLCGGCHEQPAFIRRFSAKLSVDQLALYGVSVHGRELAKGNLAVAACTSCHGFHDVKRVTEPDAPTFPSNIADTCGKCHGHKGHAAMVHSKGNPVEDWKAGVHGVAMERGDLSSPTCNDCHGSHGASPPGTADIHFACGQCHVQEATKFMASPHAEAFARLGFAPCVECHGNHRIEPATEALLAPGEDGVCRNCHKTDTAGAKAALALSKTLRAAREAAEAATAVTSAARKVGLSLPETELLEPELRTALSRMRVDVHGMKPDALDEESKKVHALTAKMIAEAESATALLELRRRGHLVFVALVFGLVGVLVLRIRRLEE
ncbi:cytochrome c3 family protein [Myxococcota bacterium]|nr:cytochrome c3 family protein [Myxococcota bacterium]